MPASDESPARSCPIATLLDALRLGGGLPLPWVVEWSANGDDPVRHAWEHATNPRAMLELARLASTDESHRAAIGAILRALAREIAADGATRPGRSYEIQLDPRRIVQAIRALRPALPTLTQLQDAGPSRAPRGSPRTPAERACHIAVRRQRLPVGDATRGLAALFRGITHDARRFELPDDYTELLELFAGTWTVDGDVEIFGPASLLAPNRDFWGLVRDDGQAKHATVGLWLLFGGTGDKGRFFVGCDREFPEHRGRVWADFDDWHPWFGTRAPDAQTLPHLSEWMMRLFT